MRLEKILNQHGTGVFQLKWNQWQTKPREWRLNKANAAEFNEIYKALKQSDLNTIIRTKSGSIKKGCNARMNNYAWDILIGKTGIRITVIIDGLVYVFKIGNVGKKTDDDSDYIAPGKAWRIFIQELEEDGIDINKYKITNGEEVKTTIEKPLICMKYEMKETDNAIENVHHIDFHNSYPSGLIKSYPEFTKTITRLYEQRQENNKYKAVLNYSIGCMQSLKHPWKAQWAHLAKAAIDDNNERVRKLAFKLKITGHEILGFNTDGIWYKGPEYHDDTEGPNLGQWSHDYINCKFRSKSNGAYEFIGTDTKKNCIIYKAVLRGNTAYDNIKPRSEWQWGDIYRDDADPILWTWDDDEGVIIDD